MGAAAAALVCNNFSPIRWKISFHMKKKSPYCSPISKLIQSIKTFLTFELSQYLQPRLSLPRKRLVTPVFVLARQTRPGHSSSAWELPWLEELGRWFCPLNLQIPSGTALDARWPAGAQIWTQTWTLPPDYKGLSPPKPQHKLCGVWILFKFVTDAKFEPSAVKFWMLMPQTGPRFLQKNCFKNKERLGGLALKTCRILGQQLHLPISLRIVFPYISYILLLFLTDF